jgi:acyl-CoA synthetase (AMP-forming)/AMP-acid ligase II
MLLGIIDEKNTKETVDDEGWIHTGDVAEIDRCGRVKIIDRVKVIIQLRPPIKRFEFPKLTSYPVEYHETRSRRIRSFGKD